MKNIKIRFFILCLCLSVTGYTSASARTEKVKTDIDWPAFMQKQDLIWEILPEYWYESAYMGNGMLGLMIYKEPGQNYIRFETGNCSVHDHKAGSDLFAIPRLLTGHFALHPEGTIVNGTMHLDIWNAETKAEITTTKGIIRLHAYVHANDMVMLLSLIHISEPTRFRLTPPMERKTSVGNGYLPPPKARDIFMQKEKENG